MKTNKRLFLAIVCLCMTASVFSFGEDSSEDAPPRAEAGKKVQAVGKRDEGDYVVEKKSDGTTVKYKKKTSYDFEGASIEGLYNKPSGSYISNIKDVKGRSIIRIRENFDAEVIDSSRLLK